MPQRYCYHSYVLEIPTSIQVLYGCLSLCVELMLSLSQTKVLLVADPRGRTLPCHFRRACLPAMICCSSCSTSLPKFPEEQKIRTSLGFVHFRHTKFGSSKTVTKFCSFTDGGYTVVPQLSAIHFEPKQPKSSVAFSTNRLLKQIYYLGT